MQYKETIASISSIKSCADDIVKNLKGTYSNLELSQVLSDLDGILDRLWNAKLSTGVVGLTKAGKSTFINALLGKSFLPSSIEPQTTKEVKIIHFPDVPDGILYGEGSDGEVELAQGRKSIHDTILQMNSAERKDTSPYDKLELHAPLVFLKGIDQVSLELSDTPGLTEALDENKSTEASEHAIKEKVAYVIILHVNLMKNKSESELFINLRRYHPDLLSELNRVLIIVNAYDLAFKDDNLGTLQPSEIPNYISEYLQDSSFLGEGIDPQHIIPISAMWALKAQEWRDDPDLLLNDPKGNLLYNEALSLLDSANYSTQELLLDREEALTRESVKKVSELLYNFSNIRVVEQKLKDMLHENSEDILLRSATDDSTSKIPDMLSTFNEATKNAQVEDKKARAVRDACTRALKQFTDLIGVFMHNIEKDNLLKSFRNDLSTSINSLTHALRNNINSAITTKLNAHLKNTQRHLERGFVEKQILLAKKQIPEMVKNVIVKEWDNMAVAIKNAADSFLGSVLDGFAVQMSSKMDEQTGIPDKAMNVFKEMVVKIRNVQKTKLSIIPTISRPSFNIECASEVVSDTNLKKKIVQGKTQKTRSEKKKKCSGRRYGLFGPKNCHKYYVSVPYDVPNFSSDTNSLQHAFMEVAKTWMNNVQKQTDQVILQVSTGISNNLKDKLSFYVDSVNQFKKFMATYETTVRNIKADIELLQSKIKLLDSMKDKLQN